MYFEALLNMRNDMLEEVEEKTHADTLCVFQAKALIETMAETVAEVKANSLKKNTMQCRGRNTGRHFACYSSRGEGEDTFQTPRDLQAEKVVDTLDNMLSKVQLVKVGNTLGIFNAEALLDTLVCALAEVEDKTLVTSRGDLEAEAVVVALVDTLVEVEANTFVYTMSMVDTLAQTLTEVKAKELLHHLADTSAKVNAHT